MSGITLADAEAQLALWLAASARVAANQSYRIGDRELTRADAGEIRNMLNFWEAKVDLLAGTGGGVRVGLAIPS